jgi:glycosyltransferase involved in cell wall biosynthesis
VTDGYQVSVLAPQGQLPFKLFGVPKPFLHQNQARWLPLSLNFAHMLGKLEREERFDLIHFTDAREALFFHTGTPMIGNVNDTYAADLKPLRYYRQHYQDWFSRWCYYHFVHFCENRGLQHVQAILANSHYTARIIQEKYKLSPKQIHVIHKSIEPEQYLPALQLRAQQPPHPPRILFVGGNMQRKGLPTLIQAAPQVLRSYPETEFWVVGRDKAEASMRLLCQKVGVEKSFHFWGLLSQAQLQELYARTDIFALPSITEAFGVVFLEAMAAGLPVIGTCVGGIPEIITDGENGLLVDPGDQAALAKALVNLLADSALRSQLQKSGMDTAHHFNVNRMMEATYKVYQEILSEKS